jgi:nitric oxide reductase subunit B
MRSLLRIHIVATLCLLAATLLFGMLASWAFLYPETYNRFLPFYQLRPFHVSAALFWIISGGTASILYFKNAAFKTRGNIITENLFIVSWLATIIAIFGCYAFKQFGGREYWEFPPVLCVPLLVSWLLMMAAYFIPWMKTAGRQPFYVWMWSTGILFFLITFIEQNLWQIPWFRYSYLREITVQWKANGATVGAWNMMIYGTSLYLMVQISGDERIARSKTAFFFYMLGLTNLMFNWGHHIYNVPTASWIRDVSYVISMTEWVFLIKMIYQFRKTLEERNRLRHLITYKFIIAAEFWVFINLLLTLSMSIPAINRYTHGTHITVAHAMGATIGINSMLILAGFSYILRADYQGALSKRIIVLNYRVTQYSLMLFWLSLIAAGVVKGYRATALGMTNFQETMKPVLTILKVFSFAGVILVFSLGAIAVQYIYLAISYRKEPVLTKQKRQVATADLS